MTTDVHPCTWAPSPERAAAARMTAFRNAATEASGVDFPDTRALHDWSIARPDPFWSLVWDFFGVRGDKGDVAWAPSTLPEACFFPAAKLNLAENLLAPWIDSSADAVVCVAENVGGFGICEVLSGRELARRVGSFSHFLLARGIRPGDRVGLVLPVGADALVCTLGALAIGAAVSSVSPEFGAPAIVDRLGQLSPRVLVAARDYRWSGKLFQRSGNILEVLRQLPSLEVVLTADQAPGDDFRWSPP